LLYNVVNNTTSFCGLNFMLRHNRRFRLTDICVSRKDEGVNYKLAGVIERW